MRIKTFLFLLMLSGTVVVIWGQLRIQDKREETAYDIGLTAYPYAYPLVLLDTTKQLMTTDTTPINQFSHLTTFPTDQTKFIVRPNVDTLYSIAWLDLTREPLVLTIPAMLDRYFVMQILDGWTNVIANPGTRTTGTGPQTYVITGPGWHGTSPAGLTKIAAPTNLVWIIGRIQTNGQQDIPYIRSLQNGFALTPLSAWPAKILSSAGHIAKNLVIPVETVAEMTAEDFFTRFATLLKANPPPAHDQKIMHELATIGIVPGRPFVFKKLDPAILRGLHRAYKQAQEDIKDQKNLQTGLIAGWTAGPATIGTYGTNYPLRAAIAYHGVGANIPADAVYPTAFFDSTGQVLEGDKKYRIHFDKNSLPPVNAFWSITVYGPDNFLVKNPLKRYALGDRSPLKFNKDGSLDMYIQKKSPGKTIEQNWLPTPQDTFSLTARLYWPRRSVLDGNWHMPAIQRVP